MNTKELLKEHLVTILCVISILALAFPLITISSDWSDESITGYGSIEHSALGSLLIILPVVLATCKYIKPLEKFAPIFSVGIPVICLLLLVLVFFTCRSGAAGGADIFSDYVDIDVKIGFGAILAALSYIALGVVGFKKANGAIPVPGGVTIPNINASAILENVQEKAAQAAERVKAATSDMVTNHSPENAATPARKSVNVNRTNEMLTLIEKLSAMKEAGVLTEEEFAQKKQALLEEI